MTGTLDQPERVTDVTSMPRLELPTLDELPGAIARLGLPVLAEQLLSFCVSFFDVYLSGRLNTEATTAIGLAAYVSWLASMISGLIGTGAAALVARSVGRGDWQEARQLTARSLTLAFVLGIGLMLVLWSGAPYFTYLLGIQGTARHGVVEYLRFDAFSQLFACMTLVAAASLRGSGDMKTPLLVLGLTNVVNMLVSSLCTFGWGPIPALGMRGIVLGTVTAQAVGWIFMMTVLLRGLSKLHLKWSDLQWHRDTTLRVMRIGGPAALDGLITFTGHFLFLMVIARLSPAGFDGPIFAAHIIGVRVEAVSYLPAVAWGAASASLAGRYLGAGQLELARQTGHVAVRQFLRYSISITVLFFVAAPVIYQGMHSDPAVAAAGVPAFRWMAAYQVPTTTLIIYMLTLRGAGDTRFPLWCALVSILGVRVPVAWLGGIWFQQGLTGAWFGMGADNTLRMLLISWRYRAGHWRETKV
ncbi:MATE family efflux transporter [bacterium]|nr:MATE family efflux transporter [bacterium]